MAITLVKLDIGHYRLNMVVRLRYLLLYSLLCLSLSLNVLFWSKYGIQIARLNTRAVDSQQFDSAQSKISDGRNVRAVPKLKFPYDPPLEPSRPQDGVFESEEPRYDKLPLKPSTINRVGQYLPVAKFKAEEDGWTVFEDLTQRDGDLIFENARTKERRIFPKRGEPVFYMANRKIKKYVGIPMSKIGMDPKDLLANALLAAGEPDEITVREMVPPQRSQPAASRPEEQPLWSSFVGLAEANDNVAIYGYGYTKNYHPVQFFPKLVAFQKRVYEGLLGGWMPAARKVLADDSSGGDFEYYELTTFADTHDVQNPNNVQTFQRTQHIRNGSIVETVYGRTYPEFPRTKLRLTADEYYLALFRFGEYWQAKLSDLAALTLPDPSWSDMVKHAFVKELLVRPGGTYPKYGAIDRDYFGSEYDGFQDIFTSSLSANLEWGRFSQAWNVIDNYMTMFAQENGSIAFRGPEVGQYGLSLSLLSKYAWYSGETDLLWKHKTKILGFAKILTDLHDESLRLNDSDPGYGLIHGWSESDACLTAKPDVYWKPYFSNSAMAIRGLRDISRLDIFREYRQDWTRRASMLTNQTIKTLSSSIFTNTQPLYVPPLPGTALTFRDSMKKEVPSPQDWPHRLYTELLHAAILPTNLTSLVHETMRNYGATSMGVVANVGEVSNVGRDILGFVSYGYAFSLLLNDRLDEFVLFLYTHRYHVHTRGSWIAGEVVDIIGGHGIFCIPAQLTIPSIMRWALVLEHPDDDVLYIGRGIPRAWLATGHEIGIRQAPTRWGRVDYIVQYLKNAAPAPVPSPGLIANASSQSETVPQHRNPFLRAQLQLAGPGGRVPAEVEVKLRMPKGVQLTRVVVNGRVLEVRNEAVVIKMDGVETLFKIEGS